MDSSLDFVDEPNDSGGGPGVATIEAKKCTLQYQTAQIINWTWFDDLGFPPRKRLINN
jgi:hypothetical protein